MAVSCWSSAKERAKGTPKKRALVVMTQADLPLKERAVHAALETVLTLPAIQPRVVGGTMSLRANRRSASVSSMGSYSDSLEISESKRIFDEFALSLRDWKARKGGGLTGIREVLISLRASLVGLEMLVFNLCKSDHCDGFVLREQRM